MFFFSRHYLCVCVQCSLVWRREGYLDCCGNNATICGFRWLWFITKTIHFELFTMYLLGNYWRNWAKHSILFGPKFTRKMLKMSKQNFHLLRQRRAELRQSSAEGILFRVGHIESRGKKEQKQKPKWNVTIYHSIAMPFEFSCILPLFVRLLMCTQATRAPNKVSNFPLYCGWFYVCLALSQFEIASKF